MNGTKLLLDSNIILYLLNGDKTLADFLNEKELFISIITEMELLSFSEISSKQQKQIQNFIDECKVVNVESEIKSVTIQLRKKFKTKLPDSIIAATSLYLNIPLITADNGFKKFGDIQLIHYEF